MPLTVVNSFKLRNISLRLLETLLERARNALSRRTFEAAYKYCPSLLSLLEIKASKMPKSYRLQTLLR